MQRILIIEDDEAGRKQLAQLLIFEGFETLEAENGRAGVASAVASVPDLIICDIVMPLDGFGVLQTLRENPRTAMIPFIFLTVSVGASERRSSTEEGADDYIIKPYTAEALIGSVRRRLERRKREIEGSRLRAEEVSLVAAASVPQEISGSLDYMTSLTNLMALQYAAEDTDASAMHEALAKGHARLRRMVRRLNLYAQLPQLYANRFDLGKTGKLAMTKDLLNRVAHEICRSWNREPDLVVVSEPAQLRINEEYMTMLIEELVDNACKYSAPGTIIEAEGTSQREFWSLAVSNHGTGMTSDQIAHLGDFAQFWNGNKKPQGLGLGLTLTQGIASLHGCEFSIQSDTDATTATVLVPLEF